jgi:hypothetical protein
MGWDLKGFKGNYWSNIENIPRDKKGWRRNFRGFAKKERIKLGPKFNLI